MSQRGRGWQVWRAVLVLVAAAAALIMVVAHWVTGADKHRISLLSYAGLFLIGVLILVGGAVTGLIARTGDQPMNRILTPPATVADGR